MCCCRCSPRTLAILAGVVGMIQSTAWFVLSLCGILLYKCAVDIPYSKDQILQTGKLLQLTYFYNRECGKVVIGPPHGSHSHTKLEWPEVSDPSTRTYYWVLAYVCVSGVWCILSVVLIGAGIFKKDWRKTAIFYPWISVSLLQTGMDVTATVWYALDIAKTTSMEDLLSFIGVENSFDWEDRYRISSIAASSSAVTLTVVFCRFFVLLLFNIIFTMCIIRLKLEAEYPYNPKFVYNSVSFSNHLTRKEMISKHQVMQAGKQPKRNKSAHQHVEPRNIQRHQSSLRKKGVYSDPQLEILFPSKSADVELMVSNNYRRQNKEDEEEDRKYQEKKQMNDLNLKKFNDQPTKRNQSKYNLHENNQRNNYPNYNRYSLPPTFHGNNRYRLPELSSNTLRIVSDASENEEKEGYYNFPKPARRVRKLNEGSSTFPFVALEGEDKYEEEKLLKLIEDEKYCHPRKIRDDNDHPKGILKTNGFHMKNIREQEMEDQPVNKSFRDKIQKQAIDPGRGENYGHRPFSYCETPRLPPKKNSGIPVLP